MKLILLIATLSTFFNTGLIWTIQLVHYPGFLRIGEGNHDLYHSFHMKAISPLVGPSMTLELLSTGALIFFLGKLPNAPLYWLGALLLIGIWVHTAFIAVPIHGQLAQTFSIEAAQKLVDTNWWRTVFWSIRAVIMAYLVYQLIS